MSVVPDRARADAAAALGFNVIDGAEVPALYPAAGARGRGIGARLLSAAKAGRQGLGLWAFRADAGARRFHVQEGIVGAAGTDGAGNEAGLPDVRLEWSRGG